MAEYLPIFKPGQAVTYSVTAAVTGGQLVEITGNRTVGPAAAGSTKVVGVAGFDAGIGANVTVYSAGVQLLKASATIAAGDLVAAAADGKIATTDGATPGVVIGRAIEAATAVDQAIQVQTN